MPSRTRGTPFGVDVKGIDDALSWLFARLPVSPAALGISGFSDGATYALGLGRANGDLFTRIVAYSPGFLLGVNRTGTLPISVSHGTQDNVLPYANTRDIIVPTLQQAGYAVDFRSFNGAHGVLLSLVEDSLAGLSAS